MPLRSSRALSATALLCIALPTTRAYPTASVDEPVRSIEKIKTVAADAIPPDAIPPLPALQIKTMNVGKTQADANTNCPYWASLGYCAAGHQYAGYMAQNCPIACAGGASSPPPPSSGGNGGGGGGSGYVAEHNSRRALHCDTPVMTRDATLEAQSQAYADTCPLGHSTRAERNGAGENLAWNSRSMSLDAAYANAMEMWYEGEIGDYNFDTGTSSGVTGHFTQVVWRSSVSVGCAVKTGCSTWTTTVVCQYSPPGNYNNQYLQEVGRLVSSGCGGTAEETLTMKKGTHSTAALLPPEPQPPTEAVA